MDTSYLLLSIPFPKLVFFVQKKQNNPPPLVAIHKCNHRKNSQFFSFRNVLRVNVMKRVWHCAPNCLHQVRLICVQDPDCVVPQTDCVSLTCPHCECTLRQFNKSLAVPSELLLGPARCHCLHQQDQPRHL